MNKNGILILTTPNPKGFQVLIKGLNRWVMIMPPHHINLFSKAALLEILENTGFELLQYETLNTYFMADFLSKHGTKYQIIRRIVMYLFKFLNIGADHLIIAKQK